MSASLTPAARSRPGLTRPCSLRPFIRLLGLPSMSWALWAASGSAATEPMPGATAPARTASSVMSAACTRSMISAPRAASWALANRISTVLVTLGAPSPFSLPSNPIGRPPGSVGPAPLPTLSTPSSPMPAALDLA